METHTKGTLLKTEPVYIRPVVLDWNIIHYWISDKMRNAIMPVLADMNTAKLQFTMSEISIFEAQCQLPTGKDTESLQFMDGIPRYPIDVNTHKIAGIVRSCYNDHEKTKSHSDSISLQDVYNAACSILNNALIITADPEDYPLPFFDHIWHWTIIKPDNKKQKIYLLAPDVMAFDDHTIKWVKSSIANRANKEKQKTQRTQG